MLNDRFRTYSEQFLSIGLAVAIVLPLMRTPGIPAFHHDWIWPFLSDHLQRLTLMDATPVDSLGPLIPNPYIGIYPAHLFITLLSYLTTAKTVLVVYLFAIAYFSAFGAIRLALASFPTIGWWSLFAGALFLGNPVFLTKLVAGHYYYLCGYAALAWGAYFLVGRFTHNPVQRGVIAGLAFGVGAVQVQFILLSLVVAIAVGASSRRLMSSLVAALIVIATSAPELVSLWLNQREPIVASLVTNPHWLQNNSSTPDHAFRLLNDSPAYYAASAHVTQLSLLWLLPVLSVIGLFDRGYRNMVVILLVSLVAATLLMTGLNGPIAGLISILFEHPAASVFRELYHLAVIPALLYSTLVPLGLAIIGRRFLPVALLLAGLSAWAITPVFADGYRDVLRQFDESTSERTVLASLPPHAGRILWLPARHPLGPPLATQGGLDPFVWPTTVTRPLFEYEPSGALSVALSTLRSSPRLAAKTLAELGVEFVAVRPQWHSYPFGELEPALRDMIPPGGRKPQVYHSLNLPFERVTVVSGVQVYRDPFFRPGPQLVPWHCALSPALTATTSISSSDRHCWQDGAVEATMLFSNPTTDPRTSWQVATRWAWAFPWLAQATAGVMTLSRAPVVITASGSTRAPLYLALACPYGGHFTVANRLRKVELQCPTRMRWVYTGSWAATDSVIRFTPLSRGAWLAGGMFGFPLSKAAHGSRRGPLLLVTPNQASPQWIALAPKGGLGDSVMLSSGLAGWIATAQVDASTVHVRYAHERLAIVLLWVSGLTWSLAASCLVVLKIKSRQ